MRSGTARLGALCAGGLVLAVAAAASTQERPAAPAATPSGVYDYVLTRNGDRIGTQRVQFRTRGGRMSIEQRIEIEVTVARIGAYRYQMHVAEFWEGDRLSRLLATTNKNGTPLNVHIEADPNGLAVRGSEGQVRLRREAVPGPPVWNVLTRRPARMVDVEDGEALDVRVSGPAMEGVRVGAETIDCQKFEIRGDLDATVWYGPDGALVRQRIRAPDGSQVYTARR